MMIRSIRARHARLFALPVAGFGLGLGLIAEHANAAQPVYFDVNDVAAQSGVTDGATYSWEAAIWNTSADGSTTAPGAFPADTPGNAAFPRFAAGGSTGVVGDATGSYTVTANSNHLIAGLFQEDGSVGSTLTFNGTGVISIDTGLQGFITRGQSILKIFNKLSGPGGISFQSNNSFGSTSGSSGSIFLYGDNDYAGGTALATSGAVNVNSSHSLGTGPISISTSPAATSGTIVSLEATGPLAFTNAITFRPTVASTLTLVSPTVAPMSFSGAVTLGNASTLTSTFAIGNTANPNTLSTLSGVIGGAGNLTKTNAGTLVLSGANTYTGITTSFGGGVLSISSDGNLGAVPASPVANAITLAGATTGGTLRATATFATDVNRGVTLMVGQPTTGDALGGTIDVTASNTLTVNGVVAGTGKLTKSGAGTLALTNANTFTGAATVSGGTLVVANGDALGGAAGAGVGLVVADGAVARAQASLPKAVTLNTLATNTSGKLDVTNNSVVIKGMADSAVRTQLQGGYSGGTWTGTSGIVTTSITSATSVGYATNAQLGNLTEFKGVTGLTGTDVLVKYTYAGDANLDGKVDIGDLGLLAGAWQQLTGKVWFDGDFTYDGAVDIGDLGLLAGNWQKGTAGNPNPPLMSFNEALAQFSAFDGVVVPEPASLSLLALAGLLGRRGRRRQA